MTKSIYFFISDSDYLNLHYVSVVLLVRIASIARFTRDANNAAIFGMK